MTERRRLRLGPDADRGEAFFLRLDGGRSAGSARRSPPELRLASPEPKRGSIRFRVFLRPRPNIADPASGVSPMRESRAKRTPPVPERKPPGLRAGKAYGRIDEPAKILEETGFDPP